MKNLFFIITYFFLLINVNPLSAQSDADELLINLQNKFKAIEDLTANFSQSVNGKTNLSGKVFYKKENYLRFELKNLIIVSDGETSWNYNKSENKLIIVNNDETTNYLSIRQIIFEYPDECDLSYSEFENLKVLTLTSHNSQLNFDSAKLFLDENKLIKRVIVDDPAGGLVQLEFSNYKLNQDLQQSIFTFTPPEGSKIIDLR